MGTSSNIITNFSHFPLANKLNADCAAGSMHLTTNILSNSDTSPPLNPDPQITISIGTGASTIKIQGPIPRDRAEIRSSHVGAAGSQTIFYPSDWEGIVSCQVQVGSCHMWGKGLEIVETRNNNTGNIPFLKLYILFSKPPFDISYFRWNYQIFPFMFTTSLFSHAFCLSTFVSFAS